MPNTRMRTEVFVVGLALAVSVGCSGDRSLAPPGEDGDAQKAAACGRECVLVNSTEPLAVAQFFADSAQSVVEVGEVTVRGNAGKTVTLYLEAGNEVLQLVSSQQMLRVEVEGKPPTEVALLSLTSGQTVHRFQAAEVVRIRYSLTRHMKAFPSGLFRLVQRTSGELLSSRRPWVRVAEEPSLTLAPTGNCPIAAPSGTVCNVGYSVSPYVAGGFGATFKSDVGSGPSHPITVTFSRAVKAVTVRIYDPDYAGNRAVAYDVNGALLGQVGFTGDNSPGVLTIETQTLTAAGIRRVELIPSTGIADGDYVAYDMNINPDSSCAPQPPDPILESENVRDAINQDYLDGLQQGQERAGWIYQDDVTGEYVAHTEVNPIHRDACEIITVPLPPALPGHTPVGSWHTHVLSAGQTTPSGCLNSPPGNAILNGPSLGDQNFPQLSGVPDYMIDEDQLFTTDQNGFSTPQDWTRDNFCRK